MRGARLPRSRPLTGLLALCLLLLSAVGARADDAHYDAVIIGGGPAGMATAIKLAQLGRKVLVLEARTRERTRAQIVGPKPLAMKLLGELGVHIGDEHAARFARQGAGTLQMTTAMTPSTHADPVAHMNTVPATHTIAIGALEHGMYAAQAAHAALLHVEELTTPVGAPRLDEHGDVVLEIQSKGGPKRTIRTRYFGIADGASSPTLKSLGHTPEVYATGHLAAAFFQRKGRNVVVKGHGVIRGGDVSSTYTLTAINEQEAALGPRALSELVRARGKKVGVGKGRDPYKVWTFEAKMQVATELQPLDGKGLVIGDAQTSPHPLTSMGVNKALLDGVDAAETIHAMLEHPSDRVAIAARWEARARTGIAAMQRAALPLYRQFGKVLKTVPAEFHAKSPLSARR